MDWRYIISPLFSMENELFGAHVVYDAKYCLKYMLWLMKTKEVTQEQLREIRHDSKILTRSGRGSNAILQKWIVRSLTSEIDAISIKIS